MDRHFHFKSPRARSSSGPSVHLHSETRGRAACIAGYLRDDVATITRPVKELRGFRRITLEPGESRIVMFVLHPSDLSFYGPDLRRIIEPGTFTVFLGTSSEALREAHFELVD